MKLSYGFSVVAFLLMGCGPADTASTIASSPQKAAAPVDLADLVDVAANTAAAGLGTLAPDFELPGSDGEMHKLSSYRGEHVVLAFFPKAFTGG